MFFGPRIGKGYDSLHEYYNELASKATGDWLMLWNDDAVMETEGWDEKIGNAAAVKSSDRARRIESLSHY
jgi:hypothetical protein